MMPQGPYFNLNDQTVGQEANNPKNKHEKSSFQHWSVLKTPLLSIVVRKNASQQAEQEVKRNKRSGILFGKPQTTP